MGRAGPSGEYVVPTLAIQGGKPVRTKPFPRWPESGENDKRALMLVLQGRNWGGYPSPNSYALVFSERFAAFQGAQYGIATAKWDSR